MPSNVDRWLEVAGGGVFLHYANISEKKADVFVDVELAGQGKATVIAQIKDAEALRPEPVRFPFLRRFRGMFRCRG